MIRFKISQPNHFHGIPSKRFLTLIVNDIMSAVFENRFYFLTQCQVS